MAEHTSRQYRDIVAQCKDIFFQKMRDYGSAWRILRTSSLTDQIFIKANRVRTIQELRNAKIDEGVVPEFVGIVNYCIMALIQLELGGEANLKLGEAQAETLFDKHAEEAYRLMVNKNHDYGEAWRDMRVSSLTDLILMKLLRIKQIEDNLGKTTVSEGIDANYLDIINYAVFAMIHIDESEAQEHNNA